MFGDGAGAAILERSEHNGFLASELGADGTHPDLLYIKAGGTRHPTSHETVAAHEHYMRMQGREVFRFAVTKMLDASQAVLDQAGLTTRDLAYLVPHQANKRIIEAAAKRLDMPAHRVLVNIEEYGNTSAASIPITLSEAVEEQKFTPGDVLVLVGFGAGLSWGAIAWRWS